MTAKDLLDLANSAVLLNAMADDCEGSTDDTIDEAREVSELFTSLLRGVRLVIVRRRHDGSEDAGWRVNAADWPNFSTAMKAAQERLAAVQGHPETFRAWLAIALDNATADEAGNGR